MKQRSLTLILLLFVAFTFTQAQADIQKLDAYFAQAQKDWDVPGMAIGIIKDGKVVLSKGYGVLEAGKATPVDGNSLFAIASNTKAFIAAALSILVEEKKLAWDDPVQKYLPHFALYDDYTSAHTTIRDLLSHRVGLGTFSGDVLWYKSTYATDELLQRIRYLPQAYEFRAGYGYSNLMFVTAGEVIKSVSGQTWADFIQAHIFQPLEMTRTQTSVEPLKAMQNVAQPHKPVEGKNQPIPYVNWDTMGAAGGIISSVNDMMKWMQLQLDHGNHNGTQIFSEASQENFWHLHNTFRVSKSAYETYRNRHVSGYGLGWALMDYAGKIVVNHGGGYDGMYSKVTLVPEENLGIVILTNGMKGISNPLTYYTLDAYLGVPEKDWSEEGLESAKRGDEAWQQRITTRANQRLHNTKPSLALDQYTGTYRSDFYGDIEVRLENESLILDFLPAPALKATLTHWHLDTFEINWQETHAWFDFGTVQFVLDNNGKPTKLQFDIPNYDIFFEEIHAERVE